MSAQQGRIVVNPNSTNRELIAKFRYGADLVGVPYSRAMESAMRMWLEWAAQHWSGVPTPPPVNRAMPVEDWDTGYPFLDPAPVPDDERDDPFAAARNRG